MCKSAALLAAEVTGSGACRCMDEKHDTIHTEQKTWRKTPTNMLLCTHVANACSDSWFYLFCVCVCVWVLFHSVVFALWHQSKLLLTYWSKMIVLQQTCFYLHASWATRLQTAHWHHCHKIITYSLLLGSGSQRHQRTIQMPKKMQTPVHYMKHTHAHLKQTFHFPHKKCEINDSFMMQLWQIFLEFSFVFCTTCD